MMKEGQWREDGRRRMVKRRWGKENGGRRMVEGDGGGRMVER